MGGSWLALKARLFVLFRVGGATAAGLRQDVWTALSAVARCGWAARVAFRDEVAWPTSISGRESGFLW